MSLLKQDGPEDVVGAGIQGVIEGFQLGKIVFLIFAGAFIVGFYVLRFLLPLILRFLAFALPILWRILATVCLLAFGAAAACFQAVKARIAAKTAN